MRNWSLIIHDDVNDANVYNESCRVSEKHGNKYNNYFEKSQSFVTL